MELRPTFGNWYQRRGVSHNHPALNKRISEIAMVLGRNRRFLSSPIVTG